MKTNKKIFWFKSNTLVLVVIFLAFTIYSCLASMEKEFNVWQLVIIAACAWGIYMTSKTSTYKKWHRIPAKDLPVTSKNSKFSNV